jgi:hypothetical protein
MRIHRTVMSPRLQLVEELSETEMPNEEPQLASVPAWVKWTALVIAIAGAILLLIHSEGAERRAIRDMPAAEHQALLARTVQNLKSICSPAEESMRDFCREQAQLALEFQDCDQTCQELADRQLSRVQLPR